jgi:hypothetical protein
MPTPTSAASASPRATATATASSIASASPAASASATASASPSPGASPSTAPTPSPSPSSVPVATCGSPLPAATGRPLFYVGTNNATTVDVGAGAFTGSSPPGFGIVAGSGAGTGLGQPAALALGPNGYVYLSDFSSTIQEYAPNLGCTGPFATLTGSNTQLNLGSGIAVDPAGYLYVAEEGNPREIQLFAPLAAGTQNVAPLASIPLPVTNTGYADGVQVALDSLGRIYVVSDEDDTVVVYPARSGATLSSTAIATITGSNTRFNSELGGIALDAANDIYVLGSNSNAQPETPSVLEFAPLAPGQTGTLNIAPIAQIVGSATTLKFPTGIAVDRLGYIYVSDAGTTGIAEFAPIPSGTVNEAPLGSVTGTLGSATLYLPYGVAAY